MGQTSGQTITESTIALGSLVRSKETQISAKTKNTIEENLEQCHACLCQNFNKQGRRRVTKNRDDLRILPLRSVPMIDGKKIEI
ncbi:hypothetical protein V1477_011923 [Vespula maculifrons]|uniref:Uncharacterized protein n=1 Tax=Vespula maculifrons TaxID=7453 RepID=A0ABD2C0K4_VESMC